MLCRISTIICRSESNNHPLKLGDDFCHQPLRYAPLDRRIRFSSVISPRYLHIAFLMLHDLARQKISRHKFKYSGTGQQSASPCYEMRDFLRLQWLTSCLPITLWPSSSFVSILRDAWQTNYSCMSLHQENYILPRMMQV